MKKLFSLMLALILVCSLIPMTASAAFNPNDYIQFEKQDGAWSGFNPAEGKWETVPKDAFSSEYTSIIKVGDKWKAYKENSTELFNITDDMNALIQMLTADPAIVHGPMDHQLGWNCNLKYHWKECACGARFEEELHVDPKTAANDTCVCGYHFSDNADLVTLWINGCPPIKGFDKNKTEYTLNAYTYKDVKEIRISTHTFDVASSVELPEDLTLKEGENKFEIKVIAENQKVTKVYTVIINKEAKK